MPAKPDSELWLAAVYRRARERTNELWLVQPMGGGALRSITFGQALDESRRIAAHLASRGYPPGSSIAILSQNCAHFVMMDLAIWMGGHVSVPLYPTMTPATIRYVLDHANARALFVGKLPAVPDGAIPDEIDGLSCALSPPNRFLRWEDVVATTAPLQRETERGAEEVGAILYTSGTTGRPKGVEHTFGAMAATTRCFGSLLDANASDRLVSYLPLAHTAERAFIEGASFASGARIYFCESLETFVADVQRARPTLFVGVPRIWVKLREGILAKIPEARLRRLLRTPILGEMVRRKVLSGLGLDRVRHCGTGAAPTPVELRDFFSRLGLDLLELYGMTENFGFSHLSLPGRLRRGWIAPPLPGVEARLGPDGEVEVKSPGTMRGYHRDPEATAAAFTSDGFLRTGDRGEIDGDGFLRIVGRTKEIFKTSKGKYVAPSAIENALLANSLCELACVMGTGEPQPFAVVVLSESARSRAASADARGPIRAELESLLASVNATLPSHEHLSRIVVSDAVWTVEDGLLTPTLKLRRDPIEARFAARAAAAPLGVSWLGGAAGAVRQQGVVSRRSMRATSIPRRKRFSPRSQALSGWTPSRSPSRSPPCPPCSWSTPTSCSARSTRGSVRTSCRRCRTGWSW
ncbi:MAG: AMP-binding protein [Deltaproteobacteria bacterium]|nr:AMP-binding protein [Deltaproteobacteria bacterium]